MSKIIPIVVDVESDGPYPPDYSMVCFGACVVEQGFSRTFKGNIRPISSIWNPDALKVSGISRDMHLCFPSPEETMVNFSNWLQSIKGDIDDNLSFWSDNPAYDWQFMNYYLWKFTGSNPFGYSARRIGDLYSGARRYLYAKWKHLRVTPHTHDPVDDARGNAEALLSILKTYKIKGISWIRNENIANK